ncbi:MAG: DUF2520 domain-containing protein [bacterium]|nr:DUF2520 domain-containing protein [bacterium]
MSRFSIIGAGNLGTCLAHSLVKKGYTLKTIFKKSKYADFTDYLEQDIEVVVRESDMVFICTQESRIREVAESIAASVSSEVIAAPGRFFYHTSNSLDSDELGALSAVGGRTASFSPLQTFASSNREPALFHGVPFLCEGNPEALERAREIAGRLEARFLPVDKKDKVHYHIAAVCAANFLISILKLSESQLKKVAPGPGGNIPDIQLLFPLIKQTLANVSRKGVEKSLTGPVKRKEKGVLKKHLQILKGDEKDLYRALSTFLVPEKEKGK